ncbi:MAG: tetratricopeptide repeat protein [Solirubrobacteraceae bacterium]
MSEHDLLVRFDERYRMDVDESWRQAHEEARAARERYDELRSSGPAGADERVELALLSVRFEDERAARPVFESALEADPDHPVAAHWVGSARLREGDAKGLELLDRAIEGDPDAVLPSCELAYGFLVERGEQERAEAERAARQARRPRPQAHAPPAGPGARLPGRRPRHPLGGRPEADRPPGPGDRAPGPFIVVTLAGRYKRFKKALAEVPGAEIYRA